MEKLTITPSIELFLRWYCQTQEKLLLIDSLTKEEMALYLESKDYYYDILGEIRFTLQDEIIDFHEETCNSDLFGYEDSLDLCKEVLESLKVYFAAK